MKQIYVCEKCGFQSDDYDKVTKCEQSHSEDVQVLDRYDLTADFREQFSPATYLPGVIEPEIITVRVAIPAPDGWGSKHDDDGNTIYRVVQYQRISNKRNVNLASVEADCIKKQNENRAENARWLAERKAKEEAEREAEGNESADGE